MKEEFITERVKAQMAMEGIKKYKVVSITALPYRPASIYQEVSVIIQKPGQKQRLERYFTI